MQDPERDIVIEETEAKAGSNEGVVRWVLLISLSLAIIALTITWVTGALNQGPVESEGTTTGRIEAERDERSSDLAEEADLVAPGTTEQSAVIGAPEPSPTR